MLHSGIDGRVSEYGDYDPAHRDVTTLAAALESGNVRSATRREERGDIFIDGVLGRGSSAFPQRVCLHGESITTSSIKCGPSDYEQSCGNSISAVAQQMNALPTVYLWWNTTDICREKRNIKTTS